ncbi:hypothetical protein OK006_10465 [Actinobacteria bacterium OK006]|nr:hypothetical protein OK006_10465 [Actinobacteria bacterium OK006]
MRAVPKPVTAAAMTTLPFLLTAQQGHAARTLLSYVAALPLSSPDAQLFAVTVAIRAARGGVGNLTGIDLRSLKLSDPAQGVAALRGLGWQIPHLLVEGDPETPVPVTVPALTAESGHPLPFGKNRCVPGSRGGPRARWPPSRSRRRRRRRGSQPCSWPPTALPDSTAQCPMIFQTPAAPPSPTRGARTSSPTSPPTATASTLECGTWPACSPTLPTQTSP